MNVLKKLYQDEEGQGMTEYIIIVAVVAVACILTWRIFGDKIKNLITGTSAKIDQDMGQGLPK